MTNAIAAITVVIQLINARLVNVLLSLASSSLFKAISRIPTAVIPIMDIYIK
jgi:hypothetical protein